MKRKHWWAILGVTQGLGTLAVAEALLLQFPLFLIVSFLLLLPGSLVVIPIYKHFGTHWSPWTLCAIAITTNASLFAAVSFLLARHRKPT
jgi:glucose-6-phosphate-specific signal transduction histidine kinase